MSSEVQPMIRNMSSFLSKVRTIQEGGFKNLHLIVDFDSTMTSPKGETSWGVMAGSKRLSPEFHSETSRLFKKYHPIEINAQIPYTDRYKAMDEWWEESHALLLQEQVTKKVFEEMAAGDEIFFRERTDELIRLCFSKDVPFLIFSAGLGDLIDACVEKQNWGASERQTSQVHVISNHLKFDESDGIARGFLHSNIHTFSKKEVKLGDYHASWAEDVRHRKNVVLMGDSLGDIHMAEGIDHDCVLKIAFLNEGQEAHREQYAEKFDVVLEKDYSMDYVLDLLAKLS